MIPYTTPASLKVRIFEIANLMNQEGLNHEFIAGVVEMALSYEGTYDLMELWISEEDTEQKNEILADLQDEVDGFQEQQKKAMQKPYMSFNDLDSIGSEVIKFKKELRDKVDQWGGVSKLAKETGIPQPSLSRFFNTATMPRRTTLHKIARAVGLSEKDIATDWIN